MDQAWKLEQESWRAVAEGHASTFYRQYMTADGFMILPSGVVDRYELISRWDSHEPLRSYELGEPKLAVVDGANVLVSYRVEADAEWLPNYRAYITSLYTWEGTGWALAFRQHTPETPFPF